MDKWNVEDLDSIGAISIKQWVYWFLNHSPRSRLEAQKYSGNRRVNASIFS